MLFIDGSDGEGGGQILRTSLALSLLTGKPVTIDNIRASRPTPGLRPQHLAGVRALGEISGSTLLGASLGSSRLTFTPGTVKPGNYAFPIGTAGSTALLLHSIYLPLLLETSTPSTIIVTGGTHVSHAPTFDYLRYVWAAWLERVGVSIVLDMTQPGFYPRGGGVLTARIAPGPIRLGLNVSEWTPPGVAEIVSVVAGLPNHIAVRQARSAEIALKNAGIRSTTSSETIGGATGSYVNVRFPDSGVPNLFTALGEKGLPAENVGRAAAEAAIAWDKAGKPVDEHAADQLVLPLALAEAPSDFAVTRITQHLLTNVAVIGLFLERSVVVEGELNCPGRVKIG